MAGGEIRVSVRDGRFQELEALTRNRAKRNKLKRCVVEGVAGIDRALAADWTIHSWVYADGVELSAWAQAAIQARPDAERLALAPALLPEVGEREEPSELIAVAAIVRKELVRVSAHPAALIAMVDRPSSPGNLGALIRSCDALGVEALILGGHGVDPFEPKTIRASVGSVFAVPIVALDSVDALLAWLEHGRRAVPELQVVGTSASARSVLWSVDFSRPTLLMFGNEKRGLSERLRELCDALVGIPMSGTASSLNLSCAATAVLAEVTRQRGGPRR